MTTMVIIDNGHGADTRGKSSPDGRLREWQWTRQAARELHKMLTERGVAATLLVPEDTDVPIAERCRRANAIAGAHPGAVLVSLHCNAAGDGSGWHTARGFCAYVHPKASAAARALAARFTAEARAAGFGGNRCTPPAGYWEANFGILRGVRCPAVLTENLFMDNTDDVEVLLAPESRQRLVAVLAHTLCAGTEAGTPMEARRPPLL